MYQAEEASSFHSIRSDSDRIAHNKMETPTSNRFPTFKKGLSEQYPPIEVATTLFTSKLEDTINSKFQEDTYRQDSEDVPRSVTEHLDEDQQKCEDSFSSCFRKMEITPSILVEKGKLLVKSNLMGDLTVNCIISYGGKVIETACRLTTGELQFENGGCTFRLSKITKMKVLYEDYQKCIWFTYDDTRNNRSIEIKFKVYIMNDIKDDLYLLFSKIIVQKLTLLSFDVNLTQKDDETVDRFIMKGELLKKSQFFGKWAMRKIVITDRIESFKCDKCTFEMKNIKQIWTRFDVYDNSLVLKVRHGSDKTEVALPIVNYPARFCKGNWMYRIYRLVSASLT